MFSSLSCVDQDKFLNTRWLYMCIRLKGCLKYLLLKRVLLMWNEVRIRGLHFSSWTLVDLPLTICVALTWGSYSALCDITKGKIPELCILAHKCSMPKKSFLLSS